MFNERFAHRSLERHRKRGLDGLERRMVAGLVASGIDGATVLEIGGGIGAVQSDLLLAGASTGEVVELVAAYEPYARQLAEESGLDERSSFHVTDILEHPESVVPADIVVLDRVVCCSPEGVELAAAAARLTRRRLALVYPRDTWWIRTGIRALNMGFRIMRRSFRVFVHRPSAIAAAAEAAGLAMAETGRNLTWEFATFRPAS
jgi:hypothetical protein